QLPTVYGVRSLAPHAVVRNRTASARRPARDVPPAPGRNDPRQKGTTIVSDGTTGGSQERPASEEHLERQPGTTRARKERHAPASGSLIRMVQSGEALHCPLCGNAGAGLHYRDRRRSYWKCPQCALVFVPPRDWPDATAEKARTG